METDYRLICDHAATCPNATWCPHGTRHTGLLAWCGYSGITCYSYGDEVVDVKCVLATEEDNDAKTEAENSF